VSLTNKASQGAKWTAISSAVNALISVAQISIVARFLEPVDFGTVAMIQVVLAIADVFVTVGFSDVLVVKHDASPEQLSTMYWLNLMVGGIAYILLFIGAPLLSLFVKVDGIESMARVMGLTLLMGSTVVQFNALMRKELYLKALAIIRIVSSVAGFIFATGSALSGFGVWALIVAALTSQLVTNAALLYFAARRGWFPKAVFDVQVVGGFIRFGVYRIGAALINNLNTKSDQLAIGAFLNTASLGLYTVAYNLAMQPFSRINPILTQVSFPVFSQVKDDDDKLLRGYRRGLRMLMAVNAPLLIGLIAIAPQLIPALLGPGWEQSITVLQVLCIYVLLRSGGNINIGLILAKEKYRWPFYWNLFLLFIIPATIFIAAMTFHSLIAVSWAVVGLQVFLSISGYLLFTRRLLGNFTRDYLSDFFRPIFSAAGMGVGVYVLQSMIHFSSSWLGLAVLIPIGGILYVSLSFLMQRQHFMELLELVKAKI